MSEHEYYDWVGMTKFHASRVTGQGSGSDEQLAAAGAAQAYATLALAEAIRQATEAFVNR
ncbi:MAG TPA: hypothetical protein VGL88_05460 [Pseudonocardiaceae bacterium]